ncbi:MAG: ABC transporter ATP-binding protein [Deltaproteobacteria bacterium]|nr:ABC transporter ATP-binding protein [Deltaproteobacteria bacterium]
MPLHALRDVSLRVSRGESVAIVGRSGAGKSTLLNLVGALDRGYQGSLRVFGQELRALPDRALSRFRNRQIGFVFQSFNLLPNLSVGHNVLLPASFGVDLPHEALVERARTLLSEFGLGDRWGQKPAQMSGGERQRVAIARALLLQPPLLVCDEPTGSLDGETAAHILDTLRGIQRAQDTALVIVTHDPDVAAACDRTVRLDRGRVAVPAEAA